MISLFPERHHAHLSLTPLLLQVFRWTLLKQTCSELLIEENVLKFKFTNLCDFI